MGPILKTASHMHVAPRIVWSTDEEATDEEATDEEATDEEATDEEATDEDCHILPKLAFISTFWHIFSYIKE